MTIDRTTLRVTGLLFKYIEEGLLFVNDEVDASSYVDRQDRTTGLKLTMPANPEYSTTAQYGMVFFKVTPDGQIEIALEAMNRRGRIIRLEAQAPSFTITEKKGKPSEYPGY